MTGFPFRSDIGSGGSDARPGQDAVPAVGSASRSDIQSAALIPDFSGTWAHLTWPDFEPSPAGPGPVTNRSRACGAHR
jgi:hypothetical protein